MQASVLQLDIYCNTNWPQDAHMLPVLVFLTVLAVPVAAHLLARRAGGAGLFRIEQFRPSAPFTGVLPEDHDAARAYTDLQAVRSHHEFAPIANPSPHH
jgi:hypothetical protein